MAVIQISKVQVRRGLQDNLPQLASGELGWSIDTQRLYIGNGTLVEGAPAEGNTEIVTAGRDILSIIRSYTFKGTESGYTSQTGSSLLDPITRSFQEKLDEQISTRDFGALGNGVTDDTEALQRAIDEVFPEDYYVTVGVRRKLHIPAGTYIISGNLRLPPYAHIEGDGPRSTIINKTSGADVVLQLRDSRGNVGAQINTTTSDAPFQVTVKDLTLQTSQATDIAELDSCQMVSFNGVRFQGANGVPVTSSVGTSAVSLLDSATISQNITFDRCEFVRNIYGISLAGNVKAVTVNESLFDTLYQGVVSVADGGSPQGIKILGSVFDNVAREAIVSDDLSSITSAFNLYANVGLTDGATSVVTNASSYTVLSWSTPNNYSIGDVFERTLAQQEDYPLVEVFNTDSTTTNTTNTVSGTLKDSPGQLITLTDASTANLALVLTSQTNSAIIDYKISRSNDSRIGTLKISHYNGTVSYEDDYSESANVGVILGFVGNVVDGTATLQHTTSSTGTDAYMKYSIRSFI